MPRSPTGSCLVSEAQDREVGGWGAMDERASAPIHVGPSAGWLEHLHGMATSYKRAKAEVVMSVMTSVGNHSLSPPPILLVT